MNRVVRRWRWWTLGVLCVAVIVSAAVGFGGGASSQDRTQKPSWASARVSRGDVQVAEQADGSVTYGPGQALLTGATGTVTWLPAEGQVVRRGGELLRVDDRRVSLLYGAVPMYRDLGLIRRTSTTTVAAPAGGAAKADAVHGAESDPPHAAQTVTSTHVVPMVGSDVAQLERNLHALGYRGFTVDRRFTPATEHAVQQWQRHVGEPATGRLTRASLVFLPAAVRVSGVDGRVGGDVSTGTMSVSALTQFVTVQVTAGDPVWSAGATVHMTVGERRDVRGRIVRGSGDSSGKASSVLIRPESDDGTDLGAAGTSVAVTRIVREHRNVLSVPVTALVAFAGGGFGVQLADRTGRYVAVRPGLYANGRVEVSGAGLTAASVVRTPR